MGTLLTKDEILRADDLRLERVEVPEWGGEVLLRTMTGTERDAFEAELVEGREQGGGGVGRINYRNLRARLLALCTVGEDGARLFSTPEDVAALGGKSAGALDRLFKVAQRLNGLSAQEVDDLTKNSEPAPNGGSTSDSRGS